MSVTEYERNQLFVWFEEHMGSERAATMMNLLPPVGWGDVSTKRDLSMAVARLDTKIDAVADRLDTKIDAVADRLDTQIDNLAAQMATKADLQELRADVTSDLQRTFVTWIFASQATVVAAVGVMLAVLR